MFPKKDRVDKKTIEGIFKEGKFINTIDLTCKFINTKEIMSPKVSFITPKTVSKKAVDRNLLRRRGYVVLKKYIKDLPVGFVGVFIFGKNSMKIFGGRKNKMYNPISNLENEIKDILNRI